MSTATPRVSGIPARARHQRHTPATSKVVLAALAGNVAVAIAKYVAFAFSGSSAMLTEAIHSSVDSIDQMLLLVGAHRAKRPRDRDHPLGHGMEMYFWSFIVALLVFGAGGVASIVEGISRIRHPEAPASLTLNLAVLAIAAVFEATSFAIAYREYRSIVGRRDTSLWTFVQRSKDPNLFATLLEDGAALLGIGAAATGVLLAGAFDVHWADGAASIAIGGLLVAVAFVLADETRSLIAGEAAAPTVLSELRGVLVEDRRVANVRDLATLHLGPKTILVAITAEFAPMTIDALAACLDEIAEALKNRDDRVAYVYVRPVSADSQPGARGSRTMLT